MAFCRWLDAKLRACGEVPERWVVRLPIEEEWEKAARGTDGREYPWGAWKSGCANIAGPDSVQQTSAVGIYPQGKSPYDALDTAGNVWEWCLNEYDNSENVSAAGGKSRVLRGGSWYLNRNLCRCSRFWNFPYFRDFNTGFRVCCAPSIP